MIKISGAEQVAGSKALRGPSTSHHCELGGPVIFLPSSLSQSRAYKMDVLLPPLAQMNYFKHFLLSCQMEVLSVWVWGAYDGNREKDVKILRVS